MTEWMEGNWVDGGWVEGLTAPDVITQLTAPPRDLYFLSRRIELDFSSTTISIPWGNDFFLLMETGDFLLQESGDKIVLDGANIIRPMLVTAPIRG